MENDTATATAPAETQGQTLLGGVADTCFFCGDPTPDMVCPECDAKHAAEREELEARERQGKIEQRRRDFRERVGGYDDTEMVLLPDTAARRAAAEYVVGGQAGLTITGPGGTGKTRSLVWVAQKEMEAGAWVEFRQCGELRQEVIQHAKHGEWGRGIRPLMNCDILILDDFGNHDFTRTLEEFILALVERRTATKKRNFISTQYTTEQVRKLFTTEQMADAILRRTGPGFATIVNTLENTIRPWK